MKKVFFCFVLIALTTGFALAKPVALSELGTSRVAVTEASSQADKLIPVSGKTTSLAALKSSHTEKPFLGSQVKKIQSGQSKWCTGSPAYSNTVPSAYYGSYVYDDSWVAGDQYGDDLQVAVSGGGTLTCYSLAIYVDELVATLPFNFTVSIYNDCPVTGSIILGTTNSFVVNETGNVVLEHVLASPVTIPETVHMVVSSSSDGVYWLMTCNDAELGYSNDRFDLNLPPWSCNYWYGGPPTLANFYAQLFLDIDETPFVTCPGGGILEGEPACGAEYTDNYNGGCNSTPEIFQSINCGDIICGQTGTYTVAGDASRDTDWFEFTLTDYRDVIWEVYGEAPLQIYLLDPVDCTDYSLVGSDVGIFGETLTVAAYLGPGTYWALVMPLFFEGYTCEVPYVATLTCTVPPVPPANDLCEDAEVILAPYPKTVTGTTLGATLDCPGVLDWNAVWYQFAAPYTMNKVTIDFCPTVGVSNDASLVVYNEAASAGCPTDCEDYIIADAYGFLTCPSTNVNPSIVWYLPAGTYLYPAITDPMMDFSFTLSITNITGMTVEDCDPASYFSHPFVGGDVYTVSDLGRNPDIISADDFTGVTQPIGHLTWWGIEIGPKTDLNYVITFYNDAAGLPGASVSQQTILATRTPTIFYPFGIMEYGSVYRYEATLTTPVSLASGWVSVAAVDSGPNSFYWGDAGESTGSSDYVQDDGTGAGWELSGYNVNLAVCMGPVPVPPPIPATGPAGIGLLLLVIGGLIGIVGINRRK